MRDPQTNPYAGGPQFFWLWCPVNFEDCATFYHLNADAAGEPWNTMGRLVDRDGQHEMRSATSHLTYQSGTRLARGARIELTRRSGDSVTLELTPRQTFYMKGLGYGHPEWGHGLYHGELETGYDVYDLDSMSPADPAHFHVQAICEATLTDGGQRKIGKGVLEQLVLGPYEPYGFRDVVDLA